MTKTSLIDYVAEKAGMSKAEAGRALDAVLEGIVEGLKKEGEVVLVGFGKFSVKTRAAREGINPATKETIKIPAKKVASFKVGSKLKDGDRVIMIEDVTTSGKSMEETVPKVKGAANVEIKGLMVSLNRMEVGKGGEKCALDEVKELYGFDTAAIVTMEEVVEYLYNRECQGKIVIDDTLKSAIDAYYEQYGAK